MALENSISVTFTQEELNKLTKGIETIREVLLGKTINLTPEQRAQYGRSLTKTNLL